MDEVPRLQRTLLTLDDEQCTPHATRESPPVPAPRGTSPSASRSKDVEVDAELLEPCVVLALEATVARRARCAHHCVSRALTTNQPAPCGTPPSSFASGITACEYSRPCAGRGTDQGARFLGGGQQHTRAAFPRRRAPGQARARSRGCWLQSEGVDPTADRNVVAEACYERWEGRGALGYLTLAAICAGQLADPPENARLVVATTAFPTGMLGYWARQLAAGGLLVVLTATSPPRLGHPEGGPKLAGTNPSRSRSRARTAVCS